MDKDNLWCTRDQESKTARSGGKYDTNQVIERLTVKDKWNFGPKTQAYYNFGYAYVDGVTQSMDDEMEYGGKLEEGQIIEQGVVPVNESIR